MIVGKHCQEIVVRTEDGEVLAIIEDGRVTVKMGVVVDFNWNGENN